MMSDDSAVELLDPAAVAFGDDALPTPEEIASAAAAAGAHQPSSLKAESAAAASMKGLGKGLGGAGLATKRKSKGGSTISAATAPAALAVRRDVTASRSSGGGGAQGSSAGVAASSDSGSAADSRGLQKAADGARSFNLKLSLDFLENEDAEWESASTDDEITELAMAGEAAASTGDKAAARTGSSKGPAAVEATAASSGSSNTPVTWREWVEDSFDAPALLLAGGVLAVCVGSLLVLGGAAWTRSRGS